MKVNFLLLVLAMFYCMGIAAIENEYISCKIFGKEQPISFT